MTTGYVDQTLIGSSTMKPKLLLRPISTHVSLPEGLYVGEHGYLVIKADAVTNLLQGKQDVIIAKTNEAMVNR